MKVIKSGDGRKVWKGQLVCNGQGHTGSGCGALLEVELSDVFKTGGGQDISGVGEDVFYTFRCMECDALTDLTKKHEQAVQQLSSEYKLPFYSEWKRLQADKAAAERER